MFCMQCGKQLPEEANFCLRCGTPQHSEAESAQLKISPASPPQAECWDHCEIVYKEKFFSVHFVAEMLTPSGRVAVDKESVFDGGKQGYLNGKILDKLVDRLLCNGWE